MRYVPFMEKFKSKFQYLLHFCRRIQYSWNFLKNEDLLILLLFFFNRTTKDVITWYQQMDYFSALNHLIFFFTRFFIYSRIILILNILYSNTNINII